MQPRRLLPLASLAVIVVSIAAYFVWTSRRDEQRASDTTVSPANAMVPAAFVGGQSCAACHQDQYELWSGSHHDLAMQVADEETVLGDFDNGSFTHFGMTSTFFKRNGKHFVRTDGRDGKLHEYEIKYTFGVFPLQQYLIEFPGGRYQALAIAWDSRLAAQSGGGGGDEGDEGGEGDEGDDGSGGRWFHLYPDARITHEDELHWTGPLFNWNYMCAECHSTNLRKNYDLESNRYETDWSEIDVACEACHGPGSRHVDWARAAEREEGYEARLKGLSIRLNDPGGGGWTPDPEAGTAKRARPLGSNVQVETCGRCHSRRGVISDDYVHGRPLLDTHRPQALTEGLYYPDGQILDEVYVYGSFLQSRMFANGVTCSDCHDPHSLKTHAPGNALCSSCHTPERFDSPSHHFHEPDSPGAACVECHMPARTYMVVDPRRDHSLRIPRPDLSLELGTPNACNQCHTDRSAAWAAATVAERYGPTRRQESHFGQAIHAGRAGSPGATEALVELASDETNPNIARASALSLLSGYPGAASVRAIQNSLNDEDPLVRRAAVSALGFLAPGERFRLASHLLNDPVRGVRVAAAQALASAPPGALTPVQRVDLDRAVAEYVESQLMDADRAGPHLNLGVMYAGRGQLADAEAAYRTALRIDPGFVEAKVNLVDLYRMQGREDEGELLLREALGEAAEEATLHYALGLLLARQSRLSEASEALGEAARLTPEISRYSYALALALNGDGEVERALQVLEAAHERHPYDREVLTALTTINRDNGAFEPAIDYARKLVALAPDDVGYRQLLQQLESGRDR